MTNILEIIFEQKRFKRLKQMEDSDADEDEDGDMDQDEVSKVILNFTILQNFRPRNFWAYFIFQIELKKSIVISKMVFFSREIQDNTKSR